MGLENKKNTKTAAHAGKYTIIGITAILISPFLTWIFGFITPIYKFTFNISSAIHLPFDYNFIESTGIFCFTTLITMILNYLFYDKLIFNKSKEPKKEEA